MCKNVKERLIFFIESQGLSKNAFEAIVGLSKRYVSNIVSSVSTTTVEKIADKFPHLNTAWLLTGEGEMLKNSQEEVIDTSFALGVDEVIETEEVEIKETPIVTPEILKQTGVNLKRALEDGTLGVEVKPTQDVLPPHNAKVYTETDEMSPEIEANDPVFVELLASPKNFEDGRMYLVNLYHGSFVRWVVRIDEEHVMLYSMKSERKVALADIKSMAEVVAVTKRPKTLPKHRVTMADVIAHKDAQLDVVNSQIDTMLSNQSRLIGILEEQMKK